MLRRLGDFRVTSLLFGAVVALMLVMQQFFPAELAMPLEGSDIRPVLLLEFASTPQHLRNIFGASDDPDFAARVAGMNIGNAIDYPFMLVYGLFVLSFFAGIARELPERVWLLFGWLGMAAAASDAVENALLFRMVADMANPLDEMAVLPFPVWTKFGLLAICCAGAAWALIRMKRWVLAFLCLPAPIMLIPGILDPYGTGPLATTLIGLGWLAMGGYVLTRWWSARSSAPTQSSL